MSNTSLLDPQSSHIDLTGSIQNLAAEPMIWRGSSDLFLGDLVISGMSRKAVVKVSHTPPGGEHDISRVIKLLNREVALFSQLSHPNIAEYLGLTYHLSDRPAIVMAWYTNGDAKTYLANRSIRERLHLIKGVIEGLCYLHGRSPAIVHGHIKGVNILVNDAGEGVLSGFRLSRVAGGTDTSDLDMNGTIRWMAPELLRGEPEATVGPTLPSDVWAFGCTFYELLLGKIPYASRQHNGSVIKDILQGALPFSDGAPREGPHELWMGVQECWCPVVEDRPNIFELKAKLDAISF